MEELKRDMKYLIELSAEIAKYNQMLLRYNEITDKRNYDSHKCDVIKKIVQELEEIYYPLYSKWFE